MSTPDNTNAVTAEGAWGEQDLGPLAWVLDELRKSLDGAVKAIRRFVREAEVARESDLASLDVGSLRIARQQLHQAGGALEMVGMAAPAQVLRAMEAATQRFVQRPELCTDAAASTLERTNFAVVEYLENVLAGRNVSSVTLFPQYRDTQILGGADRAHPADLWPIERRFREPQVQANVTPLPYGAQARAYLDSAVLRIVKTGQPQAAVDMRNICLAFAAGQSDAQVRAFWKIGAGFFEAFALNWIRQDIYVKRVASRVLMQYATLAKGDGEVAERLVHDMLFFCAQAQPPAGAKISQAPVLAAVRQAFGLDRHKPIDYEVPRFGLFDPAQLKQARKRIAAATETWSALAGGDKQKIKPAADQFSLVCDSLRKLYPDSEHLAQALTRTMDLISRTGHPPGPALSMEVATAVLFLQSSLEELDMAQQYMAERAQALAARLDHVLSGAEAQPLESWMEELYRRVSDHQTMGSVVDELRITLADAEKCMDQFFRNPDDVQPLKTVPDSLQQMRGVLSVLGLDQASLAVVRMRDAVERLLIGEVPQEQRQAEFEKLGNSLGALGFLIDMLGYQPNMARKLFVYDDDQGELRLLMGRARTRVGDSPQQVEAVLEQRQGQPDSATPEQPPELPFPNAPEPGERRAPAAVEPPPAPPPPPPAAPKPAATAAAAQEDDDDESELLDIFLEEAREVVSTGLEAIAALSAAPGDLSEQTTLRRAFHTLKGSSRMVGLTEFGEAGWAMEQVLNAWLAEQKPVKKPLLELSSQALQAFGQWADDIAAHNADAWQAQPFQTLAEAMRTRGELLPLALTPQAAAATPAQPPAPLAAVEAPPVAQLPQPEPALAPVAPEWAAPVEPVLPEPPPLEAVAELDLVDMPAAVPVAVQEPHPLQPEPEVEVSAAQWDAFSLPETGDAAEQAAPEPAPAQVPPSTPAPASESEFLAELTAEIVSDARQGLAADFGQELGFALDFPEVPASAPAPAAVQAATAPEEVDEPFPDFANTIIEDMGADIALPEPVMEPLAEPASTPLLPEFDMQAFAAPTPAVAEPVAQAAEAVDVDVDVQAAAAPEASSLEAVPVPESFPVAEPQHGLVPFEDDAVKVIEHLRISLPLYNVYLNEADEWSRQLSTALQEWALELGEPTPHTAVAWAHSLAGSSATVGFQALSGLARKLEHALQHVQLRSHGLAHEVQVFNEAAEDIRRLLHQFAAGFLKEPLPEIVQRLQAILDTEIASSGAMPLAPMSAEDELRAWIAEQEQLEAEAEQAAPQGDSQTPSQAQESTQSVASEATEAVPAESQPEAANDADALDLDWEIDAAIAQAVAAADDDDDDIDELDIIDPDLFPIFEEEAQELLPSLAGALREWSQDPDDLDARSVLLRALHTLKGSARLAGAMRLGEMAHRMESAVEQIDLETAVASDIDPLMGQFDSLQASFDVLRTIGAQPLTEAVAVPLVQTTPTHEELITLTLPAEAAAAAAAPSAGTAGGAAVQGGGVAPPLSGRTATTGAQVLAQTPMPLRAAAGQTVRVRAPLLDRLVNQAGEVMISRGRLDAHMGQMRGSLTDLSSNLERLRQQLRDIEVQSESQMQSRLALSKDSDASFDPLEFDRFTRVQELTRMMAESVNDVATVQRNMQRAMAGAEDELVAQARQTRELQRDLLRTRMVEFDSISERLYAVVRLAAKETGKQIKLDIVGGAIEMDRGVLERMTPAFEHLLRNCVGHGIEEPSVRVAAGKPGVGTITISLRQDGNDVSVEFHDDGAGLDLARIRAKAIDQGLIDAQAELTDDQAANLIFRPGFSTAVALTGLSGRGVGMDVVRTEMNALGGRIETSTQAGQGTSFRMVLPLTTAVTQVVMLRVGELSFGVPVNLVEIVRRTLAADLDAAYTNHTLREGEQDLPFFWGGALLQVSASSQELSGKSRPVVVLRSASQRIAMHVDEVLGNQEVVVKNLGPQLARLPGLTGMSVLPSGAIVLIYNPVALTTVYGDAIRALMASAHAATGTSPAAAADSGAALQAGLQAQAPQVPLVLVVDDSITVRRVTQRLLRREGYRVALAADGLQALERLQEERPTVVLSDIEMPRMDGFDLLRNIRSDAALQGLPVIMITSRIAEKHREHAMELGANHYLGKPYSDEQLLELVQHYAQQQAAQAG